jgi:superfamily II DNA or RNA helicase
MQALFKAIQKESTSQVWSRGVELARADAVSGERNDESEIALRVSPRQGMLAPLVTLYLEDEDWECSCNGVEDPCEHVTAAVIALKQARTAGLPMPTPAAPAGRLRYQFDEAPDQSLGFQRLIVSGDETHPLTQNLAAIVAGKGTGPSFDATPHDFAVDKAIGNARTASLSPDGLAKLLKALAGSDAVRVGDRVVDVEPEPILPLGHIVDAPGGVRLYVDQDPSITRIFKNGLVLCGDTLRVVGRSQLNGREIEELTRGRFFSDDQLPELVTETLPELERRIPVEIKTERLPSTSRSEKPRIRVQLERDGDRLSVLPTLVYGTPASARVDAGRLVHIQGSIPVRDEAAERKETRAAESQLGLSPGRRVVLEGDDAIAFAERLRDWPGEISGEAHTQFHLRPTLVPRLEIDGERIEVAFELPAEPDQPAGGATASATPEAVLRAWRDEASLVSLGDDGFAPLPEDWLARFGDRIADLLAARDADGKVPTCLLPDLGRLCEALDEAPPPRLDGLRPLLGAFSGIQEAPLPGDLRAELRGYQRQGIDWLAFLRKAQLGALLADDMGLGKTLQALCSVADTDRTLVVAPTSLIHNWADEIERFRPGLAYTVYHGARRTLPSGPNVVLTSYALLRIDADVLSTVHWDTVILDEAQNIKNPESQVAQVAYGLRAQHRIALTGTPVENRLDELWSQFHFLNRGLLGGRKDFQERYARPIAEQDREVTERLRERIRPFVMRRLKRDVAPELPSRTEVVLHCVLSQSEREVYDAVRAASVARVVEQLKSGGNVMAALEALLRLRQAACHAGLVPGQEAEHSSKVALLIERLEQAVEDGHKALVFSQWTGFLDRVEPHLKTAQIDFERLDGSTRDRAGVIQRFQSDDGAPVMLVSLKAGGSGLNLTAADHVFLLDPWWNPAVEDQAADRAHRIGQTRPVVIHRIVAEGTVEERILELHGRKRALSEAAFGADPGGAGLTKQDLLTLLEG